MDKEKAKDFVELLKQYNQSRNQTASSASTAVHGFRNELHSTQRLWKQGNKPILIKAGLALIAFPDPTISDVLGSAMVAAGLIQMKMRNSALHIDDVYKTLPRVFKELSSIKGKVT